MTQVLSSHHSLLIHNQQVPLGSNVRVCSNRLVHDAASGQLTGIEPSPPITGCNKQLTFERNRDWFTTTHRRRRDAS